MRWLVLRDGAALADAPTFPTESVARTYAATLPPECRPVVVPIDDGEPPEGKQPMIERRPISEMSYTELVAVIRTLDDEPSRRHDTMVEILARMRELFPPDGAA